MSTVQSMLSKTIKLQSGRVCVCLSLCASVRTYVCIENQISQPRSLCCVFFMCAHSVPINIGYMPDGSLSFQLSIISSFNAFFRLYLCINVYIPCVCLTLKHFSHVFSPSRSLARCSVYSKLPVLRVQNTHSLPVVVLHKFISFHFGE